VPPSDPLEDPSQPSEEPEPELSPGTRLGKYEIVRRLGAGGMGAVYEGIHTEIGRRVAVKVLSAAIAATPGARVRFLREAQLTTKVRHPHIVDVTDIGNEGGQAYIVMELLQGQDLSQRLESSPLSPQELADYLLPVCAAVSAAHRAGITHRDLKPQNIFLSRSALSLQPKVLDFGISKGTDGVGAGSLTGTGGVIGTPFYFAPEQILDPKSAGPASDQYALGVIMYECLTGRRPFESDNLFMVFQAIVVGEAAPPRQLRPDIPAALEQVILRAMSHDARRRFASTDELGRALLPFASSRQRSIWEDGFGPADPADGSSAPAGSGTQPLAGFTPRTPTPPPYLSTPQAPGPASGRTAVLNPIGSLTPAGLTPRPTVPTVEGLPDPGLAFAQSRARKRRNGLVVVGILATAAAVGAAVFVLKGSSKPPAETATPAAPATPEAAKPAAVVVPAVAPRPAAKPAAPAAETTAPTAAAEPTERPPEPKPTAPAPVKAAPTARSNESPPPARAHPHPKPAKHPLPSLNPNGAPVID
jgi:eukaryotic-like serine/threonine-protein kinase